MIASEKVGCGWIVRATSSKPPSSSLATTSSAIISVARTTLEELDQAGSQTTPARTESYFAKAYGIDKTYLHCFMDGRDTDPKSGAGFLRDQAIPFANIITPNQFEFELLTGSKLTSVEEAITTARQLRGRGPSTIVITSLATPDIAADQLGTLAVDGNGAWLVTTPKLDLHPLPNGMGDVFAATLLGRLMDGRALPEALELATATLYSLVKATAAGSRDLPLIAEQAQLATPGSHFSAKAA